jgi:hypothetical protein
MTTQILQFKFTKQSYTILSTALHVVSKMPPTQTVAVYLHVPGKGWHVGNLRSGQVITIREFEASGHELIKDLPKVEMTESYPNDAEELVNWFADIYKSWLKHKQEPDVEYHTHQVDLMLIDDPENHNKLKYQFLNAISG